MIVSNISLRKSLANADKMIRLLENSLRNHDDLINELPDSFIIMTSDFRIIRANPEAVKQLSTSAGLGLVGQSLHECFPAEELEVVLKNFLIANRQRKTLSENEPTHSTFQIRRDGGATTGLEQIFSCHIWNFNGTAASQPLMCLVLKDITNMLRTAKIQQRMLDELSNAGRLQQTHSRNTTVDNNVYSLRTYYNACVQMGGDWLQIEQEGTKLRIGIGDVTGHGYTAAMFSASVDGISNGIDFVLRSSGEHVDEFKRMESLARAIDERIKKIPEHKLGMTISLATIDLATGQLWLSSFGHPHPWLSSLVPDSRTRSACKLNVTGHLLGSMPEPPDSAILPNTFMTRHLVAGDRLFLYTDGLLENHGETRDEHISSRDLKRLVSRDCSTTDFDDDIRSIMRLVWRDVQTNDDVCYVIFDFNGIVSDQPIP